MQRTRMPRAELLSPAGNMERLRFALHYGADAVYLSGKEFGLRAFADNFSADELKDALEYVHSRGKRAYVTVNSYAREGELEAIGEWLRFIHSLGADAAIVSDPGVVRLANRHAPGLKLHLSTQANTLNSEAALFWRDMGVERIVLARELSREELLRIRDASADIELEVFVHGAMCVAYSGRCVLSNYLTDGERDGNGSCAQPCRWEYELVERKRPGEYLPVHEDARGTYIFNSRDLMLIERLNELISAGFDSFKIEGRMKSILYVATVTNAYRMAIDAHYGGADIDMGRLVSELLSVSHRQYTTAYYDGNFAASHQRTDRSGYEADAELTAVVLSYDEASSWALVSQRNRFFAGDALELLSPGGVAREVRASRIVNMEGVSVESAPHPEEQLRVELNAPARPMDILRKRV